MRSAKGMLLIDALLGLVLLLVLVRLSGSFISTYYHYRLAVTQSTEDYEEEPGFYSD